MVLKVSLSKGFIMSKLVAFQLSQESNQRPNIPWVMYCKILSESTFLIPCLYCNLLLADLNVY